MQRPVFHLACLALVSGALLSSTPVEAATLPYTLDFEVSPNVGANGGNWTFDGGLGGALHGVDIEVDQLRVIRAPLQTGSSYDLLNGRLNFTSGGLASSSTTLFGMKTDLSFAAGGTIVVTGVIDVDGSGDVSAGDIVGDANNPLMTGAFLGIDVSVTAFGASAVGFFSDMKHDELETLVGVPHVEQWQGLFNLSFQPVIGGSLVDDGFVQGETLSGDIVNTVPEPVTALLLATGSLGLGVLSRRRRLQGAVAENTGA